MPRYFFTFTNGITRYGDLAGEDLAGAPEARKRALRLGKEFNESSVRTERWVVQVTDDQTRHVLSVGFPELEADEKASGTAYSADKLTTVADRYGFVDRLESLRREYPFRTVLVLKADICDFHEINISYSYDAGDALLIETAARLNSVREGIVGRIGGNQFAVCAAVDDPAAGAALAELIASRLHPAVAIASTTIRVRYAVGYAFSAADMDTMTLLRRAGVALAKSKASPLLSVTAFDAETDAEIRKRLRVTADLHQAISRREFVLHYQPKVELQSGTIIGAEALIRWLHPVRGMQAPAEFIPVAEKTGLIIDIDRWTGYNVFEFARKTNHGRSQPIGFALNISAIELKRPDLVERVAAAIVKTGVDPTWITLELTESSLADNTRPTIDKLTELRALGLGLSIDDFGTAYSSLQYIEAFPLTEIKIDKSFIRGMAQSGVKRAIVDLVVKVGKELGAKVTAEGIETAAEWRMLRTAGCRFGQGYLFSRPVAEAEFVALLGSEPLPRSTSRYRH
jgi:diguanylate cyclase (GGDEF)-like protein